MAAPKAKRKPGRKPLRRLPAEERASWVTVRDAAKTLGVTRQAIMAYRSPTFRVERFAKEGVGHLRWYVNLRDVERERLRRVGPRDYELEREVLAALREGKSPVDVMERLPFVTLSDLERIQVQHARVIGTIVLDGQQAQQAAILLGIDGVISSDSIMGGIRSVCSRLDRVVAQLHAPKPLPEKAPEQQKTNGEHRETGPA